jgi:hypothetical protein
VNAVTEVTTPNCTIMFSEAETPAPAGTGGTTTLKAEPAFTARIGCGLDKNHNAFPDNAIRTYSVQLRKTRAV